MSTQGHPHREPGSTELDSVSISRADLGVPPVCLSGEFFLQTFSERFKT